MKRIINILPKIFVLAGIICISGLIENTSAAAKVVRENEMVYIVDQAGERWDVTQAETLGFEPEGFQYGMGRNFFKPLDDSHLSDEIDKNSGSRVLGVAAGTEAKAYSISRLSRHEIANSSIGSEPIAVGY